MSRGERTTGWTWKRLLHESDERELALTALQPEQLITAFDEAEQLLGSEWLGLRGILMPRPPDYATSGIFRSVTEILEVVRIASALGPVRRAPGVDELMMKLRKNDLTALSELRALTLLRGEDDQVDVEFGPKIETSGSMRRPDFRLTKGEESVFVEVSRLHTSEVEQRGREELQCIIDAMAEVDLYIAVEVGLHAARCPTEGDARSKTEAIKTDARRIAQEVARLAKEGLPARGCVPGLAEIRVADPAHASFPLFFQQLGLGPIVVRSGAPSYPSKVQHVSVGFPYNDERAEEFIRKESKQLPEGGCGALIADVSQVPGAFDRWPSLLSRRLQPTVNTRVGAIVMMRSSLQSDSYGVVTETRVVRHSSPAGRFPDWFEERLASLQGP